METQNKNQEERTILKSCIGCLFAFLIIGSIYYIWDLTFNFETIEKIERLDVQGGTIKSYPYTAKIICEDGAYIGEYFGSRKKVIYGCLSLSNDFKCSGQGKICLIKTKERIRK
jgi:hypothetical protein